MMIDREHVFGLRNEVGRDVRDITRNRGTRGVQQATKRESRMVCDRERERRKRVKKKRTGKSVRPGEDRRKLRRK